MFDPTPQSVAKVLDSAEHAFLGTVIEMDTGIHTEGYLLNFDRARFSISRIYKGKPTSDEWLYYFYTWVCPNWSTPVAIGRTFIIFVARVRGQLVAAQPFGLDANEALMEEALKLTKR